MVCRLPLPARSLITASEAVPDRHPLTFTLVMGAAAKHLRCWLRSCFSHNARMWLSRMCDSWSRTAHQSTRLEVELFFFKSLDLGVEGRGRGKGGGDDNIEVASI